MGTKGEKLTLGDGDPLKGFMSYVHNKRIEVHPAVQLWHSDKHGLSLRAADSIKPATKLIEVPLDALVTPGTIPSDFCSASARGNLSAHALLAAYVAFDSAFTDPKGRHAAWKATWPSFDNLREYLPLLWSLKRRPLNGVSEADDEPFGSESLSALLPGGIVQKLEEQIRRYRDDFEDARSCVPAMAAAFRESPCCAEESYKYGWCIVNTRSLYFNPSLPESVAGKRSGCTLTDGNAQSMALCPLIDLFNHQALSRTNKICNVGQTESGFIATSPELNSSPRKAARAESIETAAISGDELFVSYGAHSNDTLFLEYGFLLPCNTTPEIEINIHDSVQLDQVILSHLSESQKARLEAKGYLGDYALFRQHDREKTLESFAGPTPQVHYDMETVTVCACWRTEVAARMTVMDSASWEDFVNGRFEDEGNKGEQSPCSAPMLPSSSRSSSLSPFSTPSMSSASFLVASQADNIASVANDDNYQDEQTAATKNGDKDEEDKDGELEISEVRSSVEYSALQSQSQISQWVSQFAAEAQSRIATLEQRQPWLKASKESQQGRFSLNNIYNHKKNENLLPINLNHQHTHVEWNRAGENIKSGPNNDPFSALRSTTLPRHHYDLGSLSNHLPKRAYDLIFQRWRQIEAMCLEYLASQEPS